MGLFSIFSFVKKNGRFVTKASLTQSKTRMHNRAPQILQQLRQHSISEAAQLSLEYFFYTNTDDKAKALADELISLGYSAEYGPSAKDKSVFVITGWTTQIQLSQPIVEEWQNQMCDLGYKHDCEFDGWGTDVS